MPAYKEDNLSVLVTFGKYKGKSIGYVMANNAGYLLWAHKNVRFFKLSSRLRKLAKAKAEEQKIQHMADRAWLPEWDEDFDMEQDAELRGIFGDC